MMSQSPQASHSIDPIEEQLEPWLTPAQYTLVIVLALLYWIGGFVDLFTHSSTDGIVFGLYSPLFALVVLAYSMFGFGLWGGLLFWPKGKGIALFKRAIAYIQDRAWLGIGLLLVFAALIVSMVIAADRWVRFPLLAVCMLLLAVTLILTVVFARPLSQRPVQLWRKVAAGALGTFLVFEIGLQAAAFIGILPFDNLSGIFTSNGRLYLRSEGMVTSAITNRYGWYYPDQKVDDSLHRVIVLGTSYVLGLPVQPEQNLGFKLQERLEGTQVFSFGFPDYGPGLFTDPKIAPYIYPDFKPNEVIVLIHPANDLQAASAPTGEIPHYSLNANGDEAGLTSEGDSLLRHNLQHLVIRGYEPLNPINVVQSHLFTMQLARKLLGLNYVYREVGDLGVMPVYPTNVESADDAQPFGKATFAFDTRHDPQSETAMAILISQLKQLKQTLDAENISMRLVTIPYFPAAFYAQQGANWSAQLGEYDALLPEVELGKFAKANDLPFLPMGEYMQQAGMTTEQIRALFFKDGVGHFTPEGHAFFATAMQRCFYAPGDECPLN
jgi:hypothetical protein